MATFNQKNQNVQNQYNAETINFSKVQAHDDFFQRLERLQAELERAIEEKVITGESAIDVETHVKKALLQKHVSTPDKKTLIKHLTSAKELVTNVEGLATAFAGAIATIGELF